MQIVLYVQLTLYTAVCDMMLFSALHTVDIISLRLCAVMAENCI